MADIKVQTVPLLPGEVLVRRKGGSVIHVMKLTEAGHAPATGALCGTVAQDSRYSSMRRAGWYQMTAIERPTCKTCQVILAERLRDEWRKQYPELHKLIAEVIGNAKKD